MTRLLFERLCRALTFAALLTALWSSLRAGAGAEQTPRRVLLSLPDSIVADTGARGVGALRPLLDDAAPDTAVLTLGLVPSATMRAAWGAMAAAGIPVQWVDRTGAAGLAVSVSRSAVPGAALTVRASANTSGALVLRDVGGVLDSVPRAEPSLSWQLAGASPPLVVQQGKSAARVALPDSAGAKRVLVIAQPGWEGKFVVAALEESGWLVDGRLRVSPSGSVTLGAPERLDLERYAAVVVLDSMSVDAGALQAFVARGGGLVFGGDALQISALAALRPARPTLVRGAIAGALLSDDPRAGLEAWELAVAPGAVVLQEDRSDHGHSEPALVARRVGRGRVVAMPYRETWRWRMQGTDNGAAEHRRWWQGTLAAAIPPAERPRADATAMPSALPGGAAPYADLVARVGRALSADSARITSNTVVDDGRGASGDIPRILSSPVLLLVTLLALLAEWSSRRLRGLR
jgi:hypothetical protein